jgi:hypothetical protein
METKTHVLNNVNQQAEETNKQTKRAKETNKKLQSVYLSNLKGEVTHRRYTHMGFTVSITNLCVSSGVNGLKVVEVAFDLWVHQRTGMLKDV